MILGLLKAARATKKTFDSALHPIEWCRDKAKGWILDILMKQVLSELKQTALTDAFKKVEDKSYSREYEFEVPAILCQYVCTEDGLNFINDSAAIMFNEPLFVIGLKLGRIKFVILDESHLKCFLEFRVHSTQTTLTELGVLTN